MKYRKHQIGWSVIGIMIPILVFLYLSFVNQWGDNPLPLIPFAIIAAVMLIAIALFYKLNIEVDRSAVKVIYGIGLIRFKLTIDELHSAEVIKTPWYYGLGIRVTPKGMLYNIHGLQAVELKFSTHGKNKTVMIGSPEPEKLKRVIDENFKRKKRT